MKISNNRKDSVPKEGQASATSPVTRSAQQVLFDCIDEHKAPLLSRLLEAENGDAIRAELLTMIESFVPRRAPRERIKILGKLLRTIRGATVEEAVVIRDISETGIMLAISAQLGISASELARIKLLLRIPNHGDSVVEARLVRVIQADARFIQAGFEFIALPEQTAKVLPRVQHMHSDRTSQIAQQRISQMAPPTKPTTSYEETDRNHTPGVYGSAQGRRVEDIEQS